MAAKRQLVVFRIGGEEFAADILLTKEVVVWRDVTPVPETREFVEGVMNLRGNLVPVLDLRKRLRAEVRSGSADRRIIIANIEGQLIGLIVDGASEVIKVEEVMVEPPPDIVREIGGYIAGVINLEDRVVTIIDLKKVLSDEITCELGEVMRLLTPSPVAGSSPAQAV